MDSINNLNSKLFKIIDSLHPDQIRELHNNFIKNDIYGSDVSTDKINPNDINTLKKILKIGIQKIPAEDLIVFAPSAIVEAIRSFQDQSSSEVLGDIDYGIEPKEHLVENQENLIREAIEIATSRSNDREEIPRDKQSRFGYILAKLNAYYKIPKSKVSELISVNRLTVTDYTERTLANNPDLKKLWSESAEEKANIRVEKTIAEHVSKNAMESIQDTITLGNYIRDKYMIPAVQKGFNLNKKDDIIRLTDAAIKLYFSHEKIYVKILEIERRNDELLRENRSLKELNHNLEEIVLVLN